jgi:CPA2 family monovalent cation:H+ antiporter-2
VHDETSLIELIAIGLAFSFIGGYIAVRLKLSPIIGYLAAGIVMGPYTPGFVEDTQLAGQIEEIGIILLMFGVGMHFSMEDLWAMRAIAVPGAVIQILTATALGVIVTHFWGWSLNAGLVFGLALSVASTVVMLRTLESYGVVNSADGKIAIGWTVVEDVVMVLVLVLLPAFFGQTDSESPESGHTGPVWLSLGCGRWRKWPCSSPSC